jgi:hypothetical protein
MEILRFAQNDKEKSQPTFRGDSCFNKAFEVENPVVFFANSVLAFRLQNPQALTGN